MNTREEYYDGFLEYPHDTITIRVERGVIEEGVSFSPGAMQDLFDQLETFIGAKIMRRWKATDEPPSMVEVEIKVTAA